MNSTLSACDYDIAVRADFLHFVDDPDRNDQACQYLKDGLLLLKQGRVVSLEKYNGDLKDSASLYDYSGKLIMPGFFDTHTHYPQTDIIASYGAHLLEWLEKYTFPT